LISATKGGLDSLLSTFINGLHKSVRKAGKTPVVWEELVLDHSLDLEEETVVLSWINSVHSFLLALGEAYWPCREQNHTAAIVEKGFRTIHAPSDYFYLDCGLGSWLGNTPGGASWCSYVSWQKVRWTMFPFRLFWPFALQSYSFDPFAGIPEEQRHLVLGGESLLWTEQVDANALDSTVWFVHFPSSLFLSALT
jgi:hexosaminidase